MRDFNEILTNDEKWPWEGARARPDQYFRKERLDRAVANPKWLNFYKET